MKQHEDVYIDYDAHPAFAGLATRASSASDDIYEQFQEIDRRLTLLGCPRLVPTAAVAPQFRASVEPALARVVALAARALNEGDWFSRPVAQAVERLRTSLLDEVAFTRERQQYTPPAVPNGPAVRVFGDLRRDGCSLLNMGPGVREQLRRALAEPMNKLRGWAADGAPRRATAILLPREGDVWEILRDQFARHGVLEAVSLHLGHKADVMSQVTLQLSHPGEVWFKDCYADAGLPTSRLAYLHYDADVRVCKALAYLHDVTPAQGPFEVIAGSNRCRKSEARDRFLKALDVAVAEQLAGTPVARPDYYRPAFADRRLRAELLKAPACLRGSSHFGDDVLDGSPLEAWLAARAVRLTTDVGDLMVFDGARTLHRGGQVESGERFALQIGFYVVRERTWASRIASVPRRALGRVRRALRPAR